MSVTLNSTPTASLSDAASVGAGSATELSLTVLTWNIWFGRLEFAQRSEAILEYCAKTRPDIICFQEVTRGFVYEHLRKSKLIEDYDCSEDMLGKSIEQFGSHYSVLILAKKHLGVQFTRVNFHSAMGRSLLSAVLSIEGKEVSVGTVHLESLDNHDSRRHQLGLSGHDQSKYSHAILCGDFNFCSYRNFKPNPDVPLENNCLEELLPQYRDMWKELVVDPHLHEHHLTWADTLTKVPESVLGYTFDSDVNLNIDHHERFRLDRMMYKLPSTAGATDNDVLIPRHVKIIGTEPINKTRMERYTSTQSVFATPPKAQYADTNPVFPSDHFGLLAAFGINPVK